MCVVVKHVHVCYDLFGFCFGLVGFGWFEKLKHKERGKKKG
jgi:hypothetical protein